MAPSYHFPNNCRRRRPHTKCSRRTVPGHPLVTTFLPASDALPGATDILALSPHSLQPLGAELPAVQPSICIPSRRPGLVRAAGRANPLSIHSTTSSEANLRSRRRPSSRELQHRKHTMAGFDGPASSPDTADMGAGVSPHHPGPGQPIVPRKSKRDRVALA